MSDQTSINDNVDPIEASGTEPDMPLETIDGGAKNRKKGRKKSNAIGDENTIAEQIAREETAGPA